MNVETYEIEQNTSEASELAKDGAAMELIESLGLNGQKRIVNPKTDTRNPYRVMEKQEQHVFSALLTKHVKLEEYDADAIPLRVLQVAAHAKQCGLFDIIEVWYAEPGVIQDDPILVGQVKTGDYSHRLHILARWGKALQTVEQLEAVAVTHLRKLRVDQCRSIIERAKAHMALVEQAQSLEVLKDEPTAYNLG